MGLKSHGLRRPRLLVAAALVATAFVPTLGAHALSPSNGYTEYHVSMPHGESGEPSIGWDPNAKAAMYGAGLGVTRLTWDDTQIPATLTQQDVTFKTNTLTSLDTITVVDQGTHRTFQLDLAAVGSLMAFSDNAGASWTPSSGISPGSFLDHESLGAGPFAIIPQNPVHPHAVYYCSQNGFNGDCGVSLDGGVTFLPARPAYNTFGNDNNESNPTFIGEGGACSALHGHIRVGADGAAYLPIKGCHGSPSTNNLTNSEFFGGTPALSVSENNGLTWDVRVVPGQHNQDESDPSVSITPNNTVYFGWQDGTNPSEMIGGDHSAAKIGVSHDHGHTWSHITDVTPPGVNNVQFPEVISGDDNRAAFAFLGTTAVGDDQSDTFRGEWHMYVATTYDGGASWSTVDATPNDPVQRGCIDLQGIAPGQQKGNPICTQRNLLDFNDITVDSVGRVLVAYTKGCTGACITDPAAGGGQSRAHQDWVLRQTTGQGLYAKYDGVIPAAIPAAGGLPDGRAALLLPFGAVAAILVGRRRRARSAPADAVIE